MTKAQRTEMTNAMGGYLMNTGFASTEARGYALVYVCGEYEIELGTVSGKFYLSRQGKLLRHGSTLCHLIGALKGIQ